MKIPGDIKVRKMYPPKGKGDQKREDAKLRGRQICQLNNLITVNADIIEELVESHHQNKKKNSYL